MSTVQSSSFHRGYKTLNTARYQKPGHASPSFRRLHHGSTDNRSTVLTIVCSNAHYYASNSVQKEIEKSRPENFHSLIDHQRAHLSEHKMAKPSSLRNSFINTSATDKQCLKPYETRNSIQRTQANTNSSPPARHKNRLNSTRANPRKRHKNVRSPKQPNCRASEPSSTNERNEKYIPRENQTAKQPPHGSS